MHEADDAVQQAIEELRRAQLSVPDDLADEVQEIIEEAESFLEKLRRRSDS